MTDLHVDTRAGRHTLVATILGSGIVFLDSSISSVALPAIQGDLGLTVGQQQWIVSSYLLTLSTLLLVCGKLGDLYGHRRLFRLGLAAYALLSTAAALSPNAQSLIAVRALLGVAGALLVPASLAIISALFVADERGRAIGLWSAWSGITTILGPLVGGLAIDRVSWRPAFLIGPLLAVLALLYTRSMPETSARSSDAQLDLPGVALVALGLAGLVYALIQAPLLGWAHVSVLVALGLGAGGLIAFVVWEMRAASPIVPRELVKNRNLVAANLTTMLLYAALYGALFYVTLYVQSSLGYPATIAGLGFVPITLLLFLLSPYAGRLHDRHGPRWLMTGGPLTGGAGLALIAFTREPEQLFTRLLPGMVVLGIGMGFTVAPLVATAISSAGERNAGVASGLNNAVSRVAALVAIVVLGAVAVGTWHAGLDAGQAPGGTPAGAWAALERVRDKTFVLPSDEAARAVAKRAAQDAFGRAMLLASALAVGAGLVSAAFIRGGGAADQEATGAS